MNYNFLVTKIFFYVYDIFELMNYISLIKKILLKIFVSFFYQLTRMGAESIF